MVLSQTHKFVFVQNPRTASTSIFQVLKDYNELKQLTAAKISRFANQSDVLNHLQQDNAEIDFSDFYEFVFVRNPYARFVSLYMMFKKTPIRDLSNLTTQQYIDKFKSVTIDKLLDKYETVLSGEPNRDGIAYSQMQFVSSPFTTNLHVYKYEELESSWEKIKSDLNMDLGNLPHLNRSVVQGHADILLPRHKKRISELFSNEFEHFGYDK